MGNLDKGMAFLPSLKLQALGGFLTYCVGESEFGVVSVPSAWHIDSWSLLFERMNTWTTKSLILWSTSLRLIDLNLIICNGWKKWMAECSGLLVKMSTNSSSHPFLWLALSPSRGGVWFPISWRPLAMAFWLQNEVEVIFWDSWGQTLGDLQLLFSPFWHLDVTERHSGSTTECWETTWKERSPVSPQPFQLPQLRCQICLCSPVGYTNLSWAPSWMKAHRSPQVTPWGEGQLNGVQPTHRTMTNKKTWMH